MAERQVHDDDLNFGIGSAGTGKTYLTVASAVDALARDTVRGGILARPAVEAGERFDRKHRVRPRHPSSRVWGSFAYSLTTEQFDRSVSVNGVAACSRSSSTDGVSPLRRFFISLQSFLHGSESSYPAALEINDLGTKAPYQIF